MVAMASANLMVADLIFSLSLSKIFEVSSLSRTQCLKVLGPSRGSKIISPKFSQPCWSVHQAENPFII
jgi:hypothetical protein